MSAFFNKLPLEIRNFIYEELLLDKKNPLGPQYDGEFDRKTLYPTILETCKQAYVEGSRILYECNVFRVGPPSGNHHEFVNCDFENKNFVRIKHLEMAFNDNPLFHILGIGSTIAPRLTTVMKSLAKLDCTLRTLRLDFKLPIEVNVIEGFLYGGFPTSTVTASTLKEFVLQEDFREAVVTLKVESMIKISMTSYKAEYCTIFQELADAIGSEKKWAVKEDPYAIPEKPTLFKKQWVLTPATSATRKGSEIDGRSLAKPEPGSSCRDD